MSISRPLPHTTVLSILIQTTKNATTTARSRSGAVAAPASTVVAHLHAVKQGVEGAPVGEGGLEVLQCQRFAGERRSLRYRSWPPLLQLTSDPRAAAVVAAWFLLLDPLLA